jgi:hypothetical protein
VGILVVTKNYGEKSAQKSETFNSSLDQKKQIEFWVLGADGLEISLMTLQV